MSLSFAGIDIADSIINLEFRLGVLERVLDRISPTLPAGTITAAELEKIRVEVMKHLQTRFPEAGIIPKSQGPTTTH